MHTYNRRASPSNPIKGFLDPEFISIEAAIRDTQAAVNTPSATAPIVLAADVSNSVAATDQATGLKANVVTGKTYFFRWTVFVSSNANTGGLTLKVTHPTYTASLLHVRGNSTAVSSFTDGEPTPGASPSSIGTAYVAYSGTGIVIIEHRIVPSAAGSVELTLNPTVNGQNYTVLAGSTLEVFSA